MEVWIGLVGVGPLSGNETLGEAKGAYVNALALASDRTQYEALVTDALQELALFPFEFEDVESFDDRASRRVLDDELVTLAHDVKASGKVHFATFHVYARLDN